jgi:hypothetical protein
MRIFVFAVLIGIALGCANEEDSGGALVCNAASCSCPMDGSCEVSEQTCEGTCSLDCQEGAVCEGECGESCSIDCAADSTCDVTVGKSGSVSCGEGATCHVRCEGDCSLSCSASEACSLQCPGDGEPRAVTEGGGCESP